MVAGALMLVRDIAEIRVKEEELMIQTVVIKEIHHRIKNNLQTVARFFTPSSPESGLGSDKKLCKTA